jgi:hypothetical protein
MSEDKVVSFRQKDEIDDPLTERFCRKLFLAVDWDMIAGNDSSGTAR